MNDIGKRGSISFSEIFAQEEETKKKNKEIINKIKFKTTDSINSIGGKIDDIKGNEGYLMINGKFIKNEDIFFELDGEKNPNYPGSTFLAGKIKNIMEKNLGLSKEFDETNLAHSEQIMIAHLMDILRLKTNKEKINVKIFTFRPCCSTCYETIEEFNKIYKNDVNLEVIDFGYDKSDFTKKPSNYYTKGNGIFKNIDDIDDLKILESFDEINNGRKTINFGNTTLIGNKEYTIESLKFKTNNIEAINNEEVKKKSEELEAKIKEFRSKFDKFRKEVEKLERYKGEKLNKIHSRELRELEEIEKLKIKELNSDKQKL